MRTKKHKVKALVLFSGGLDSILAAKILIEQGIEVIGLTFKSYFFDSKQAEKISREIGINLKVADFSREHLKLVKSPKHNYGKSMNPCIDCHILMLKKAKEIMETEGFDFVATGEVLGQRPMSQNRGSLKVIKKQSSLNGYLLRPLSAKLLEETIPEKEGLVDREKLFSILGRSRKKQIELANKFKIREYPNPAGGCLLTDIEFGKRLKKLLIKAPYCNGFDVNLLKYGRHFWKDKVKIVVGRNQEENSKIEELFRGGDALIAMKNYSGPLTLIRNYGETKISRSIFDFAKDLTRSYSTKARNKENVKFDIKIT